MDERRLVETFNTHRMSDEVVRALSTGRDDELKQIVPAIRRAAQAPQNPPPALIVYGERGSGKSFLMRLVQMACADIDGVACVLLPEEQYNIRAPQQLLQVVAAHLRGEDWAAMGWQLDARSDEDAWTEDLQAFHAALDARFGAGQGLAVVLLENFDMLVEKLFGAKPPAKGPASGPALARRQAEERLRKLMNARNGRFMLVASATGTVDMDYERPLFAAFTPVDLHHWSADTAIDYFNKRRALDQLPPLTEAEQARARAIIEFIGGNVRLAQLLGTVLSSPTARTIADTLDELVDKLADYYRQRMEALPPAAAAVLDALIRGGEPVSQTALGQRLKGDQRQIADAFSYLTRSRLLRAASERGGASQLYSVRDRLFVHFYRRRYGSASSLAAIAELLERFFTPDEREQQIRQHLERGEFDDARAFGRLPLEGGAIERGFGAFRDTGITDGPPRVWFEMAGVPETQVQAQRELLRKQPDRAYKQWIECANKAASPLAQCAARGLAAVAASRNRHDQLAKHVLQESLAAARSADDADVLIIALDIASVFFWHRTESEDKTEALALIQEAAALAQQARSDVAKAVATADAALLAYRAKRYDEAERLYRLSLTSVVSPQMKLRFQFGLAYVLQSQGRIQESLAECETLLALAREHGSLEKQCDTQWMRAGLLEREGRYAEALASARDAADIAGSIDYADAQSGALYQCGWEHLKLGDAPAALEAVRLGRKVTLDAQPPLWGRSAACAALEAQVLLDDTSEAARRQVVSVAGQALDDACRGRNKEVANDAVASLMYASSLVPNPGVVDALRRALELDSGLALLTDDGYKVRENWPWAVARAQAWDAARDLVARYPALIERADAVWTGSLGIVGKLWSEAAEHDGRAAAFARAGKELPVIQSLLAQRIAVSRDLPADWLWARNLASLTAPLTEHCPDPGLLRDIADLLQAQCGEVAEESATRLRQFADLHAAPDKEAYLQRIDPDLATAMRRIWNLPEPPDTLSKRGRPRAR